MDQKHMTEEEAVKTLLEAGYKERVTQFPWYRRLKCRLVGPHDWAPLMRMLKSGALIEEGQICDICHKEKVS